MVLRNKYDIFSFLGAICILFALMFMAFWYTCSLEVQDREMPKIQLPERSKVPPKVRFVPYPDQEFRMGQFGSILDCPRCSDKNYLSGFKIPILEHRPNKFKVRWRHLIAPVMAVSLLGLNLKIY